MRQVELNQIIAEHTKWLQDNRTGQRANLRYTNLRDTDLSYTDLSYTDLGDADLSYADLSYTDLRNADLRDTDLRNANLRNTNLRNVDLRNANLRSADLCGANGAYVLDMYDPRGYVGVAIATGSGWRIFAGCRSFTTTEALEHWNSPDYTGPYGQRYVRAINELPECPKE